MVPQAICVRCHSSLAANISGAVFIHTHEALWDTQSAHVGVAGQSTSGVPAGVSGRAREAGGLSDSAWVCACQQVTIP